MGDTVQTTKEIEAELVSFFDNLLTEPVRDRSREIHRITQNIPSIISQEQNNSLMSPISLQEVEEAVKGMNAGTAPGPDGFTIDFFQSCWEIIK